MTSQDSPSPPVDDGPDPIRQAIERSAHDLLTDLARSSGMLPARDRPAASYPPEAAWDRTPGYTARSVVTPASSEIVDQVYLDTTDGNRLIVQLTGGGAAVRLPIGASVRFVAGALRSLADMLEEGARDRLG